MTRIARVLRTLAASSDPQALRIFIEYGFGRPVDRVEVDEVRPKTTLRLFFAHEFDKKFGLIAAFAGGDEFRSAHARFYQSGTDAHSLGAEELAAFQKVRCLVGCKSEFVPVGGLLP